MKKIFCELCEGTEFTKDNGMFVCSGCGTKYTAEEARSLMREVEGDVPVSTGAPVVGAPMGNPNQAQIDNILVLATTAYEAQNYAEAENYCNRAIELDAMCYKAWNLKGKAVGWQSKIDNLRIEEAAHSFCKAIDFGPEDEKEELKNQASEELKRLGLALISLRKNRFSVSPDREELNGFNTDKKVMLSALLVLLSHGNAVGIPEGYLEEVAKLMTDAADAALKKVTSDWKQKEHPDKDDLLKYMDRCSNIEKLLCSAIDTSEKDDEADIWRYRSLIRAIEAPMDSWGYKREWNPYSYSYQWVQTYHKTESAKQEDRRKIEDCKNKISAIESKIKAKEEAEAKKAKEEKQARIAAYWEAHAEEKAALDGEKAELNTKVDALIPQITELNAQIKAANPSDPVPSEAETLRLNDQIKELESRRARLGVFAGKEKKQIGEEIASLNGRVDSLKARIEEEKRARKEEVDKKIAPLRAKYKELRLERDKANKRISAINAELTRDPEE